MGEGNSDAILECYVEVLKKSKRGSVETKCTEDAVVAGWEKLSGSKLGELMSNASLVTDN